MQEEEGITGVVEIVFRDRPRDEELEPLVPNPLFVQFNQRVRDYSVHAVHIAIFVTEHARQWLYEQLEKLGEQVAYLDTDSVFYVRDTANPEHRDVETNMFLGGMKDELDGDRVILWGSGGPKNYAYLTASGKSKSVVKGLPRTALDPRFQIDFLKLSVMAETLGEPARAPAHHVVKSSRLKRARNLQTIHTIAAENKSYKMVNNKVALFPDGSTLPLGHRDIETRRSLFRDEHELWLEKLDAAADACRTARARQREHDVKSGRVRALAPGEEEEEGPNEYLQRQQRERERMQQMMANWRGRMGRMQAEGEDADVEFGDVDRDSMWMELGGDDDEYEREDGDGGM